MTLPWQAIAALLVIGCYGLHYRMSTNDARRLRRDARRRALRYGFTNWREIPAGDENEGGE